MSEIFKNKKKHLIISAAIILIGMIIIAVSGLNVGIEYSTKNKVELLIGKEFVNEEITEIVKEVIPEEIMVKTAGIFKDTAIIYSKQISAEQKDTIVDKINAKYELELDKSLVEVGDVSNNRLRDLVKPYIMPIVIATALVLIYMLIRYKKIGPLKVLGIAIAAIIGAQLFLLSVYAITRISVTQSIFAISLFVYVAKIIGLTFVFEKMLKELKAEENSGK